ncbi:MAG: PDZ domain-containing protein [Lacipirellulaceae bacterium]
MNTQPCYLLGALVAASIWLPVAADEPGRSAQGQDVRRPVANAEGDEARPELRVLGLTLVEKRDADSGFTGPYVEAVFPNSPAWDAGLREGDRILAFASIEDVDFETFADGIRSVCEEKHVGEKIPVKYHRDDEEIDTTIAAQGLPPEEAAAERKARSVDRDADTLASQAKSATAPQGQPAVDTEMLEEMAALVERSRGGALAAEEEARLWQLEARVYGRGYGGGYWGGYGGGLGFADQGLSEGRRDGAAIDPQQPGQQGGTPEGFLPDTGPAAPGNRAGELGANRPAGPGREGANGLSGEFAELQQAFRSRARFTPAQQRRFESLSRVLGPDASTRREAFTRGAEQYRQSTLDLQELNAVQQRGGRLNPQQTRRVNELQQSLGEYQQRYGLDANGQLTGGGQAPGFGAAGANGARTGPGGRPNAQQRQSQQLQSQQQQQQRQQQPQQQQSNGFPGGAPAAGANPTGQALGAGSTSGGAIGQGTSGAGAPAPASGAGTAQ